MNAGTFNFEVLNLIWFHQVLHPRNASSAIWKQMSMSFVTRFLYHLMGIESPQLRNTFASFLKKFLDKLLPSDSSERDRFELAFKLCNIAFQQSGQTFLQVCDLCFPFYQLPEGDRPDLERHLAVAAIYLGHKEYVKEHLSTLLLPKMMSEFFGTPLYAACAVGDLWLVRSLLESGADVNQESLYAGYPLEAAVSSNHIETVRELLMEKHRHVGWIDDRICALLSSLGKPAKRSARAFEHWKRDQSVSECVRLLRVHYSNTCEKDPMINRTGPTPSQRRFIMFARLVWRRSDWWTFVDQS
ncbi:hypothetical protein IWZ01DRAFT_294707 [Phyllosticta capitalensis]